MTRGNSKSAIVLGPQGPLDLLVMTAGTTEQIVAKPTRRSKKVADSARAGQLRSLRTPSVTTSRLVSRNRHRR